MTSTQTFSITRKDLLTNSDPRWCAGCGCYSILNSLYKTIISSGQPKESFAVISGIGCSSRLPYYTNTYGFHTIHGRAPTVAMGLKLAKPEQNVWIATGDGDALSIGGNHFIHLIRRNPNIKLLLFNNQIYGLTKGQLSPTSPIGTSTKTSPHGSIDRPLNPMALALGAGATFVARVPDNDNEMMLSVMEAAHRHKGIAIIEILINCVIFNDGAYEGLTDKENRSLKTIKLESGKPLLFGQNKEFGIQLQNALPKVVKVGENGNDSEDILIHDPSQSNMSYAFMLAEMGSEHLPLPIGILRSFESEVYEPYKCLPTSEGYKKAMLGNNYWETKDDGHIQKNSMN